MDSYGYPDDGELETIRSWPWRKDYRDLLALVRQLWAYADWGWSEEDVFDETLEKRVRRYNISTAGWSGNEDLIRALQGNILFWSACWVQSRRGGHYLFDVPIRP